MAVLKNNPEVSDDEIITDEGPEDLDDVLESESEEDEDMKLTPEDLDDAIESDPEEDEDMKLTEPKKNSIYNRDGLLDKLNDISWPENVDWKHKLSVDYDQEQAVDVNDDLTRELAFYTQALEGTRQAFLKFQTMGLPFLRPPDYYAEMVKTDSHMEKVKVRLLAEKKRIEEAEERRRARDNKKKSKEVQAQKQKERIKQKKDEIQGVKEWRKQRQQSGFPVGEKNEDMGLPFEDGDGFERGNKKRPGVSPGKGSDKGNKKRPGVSPWDRSGGKAKLGSGKEKKGGDKKRKSRDFKDSKFGFGGKKGMKKQNTSETASDLRGFNQNDFSKNKKMKK